MATTQKSIEKLNKYTERLELLNRQLEAVNKNTKEYKKLLAEKASVENKAIKASRELSNAQGKLSSTLPNHKKLIKESADAQKKFNTTTSQGTKVSKGFFGRLKSATGTLLRYSIAYKAINLAQNLFNELVVGSIKQAIAFEKSLANLGAVAGVSGKNLKSLSENALSVAGSTKFTATEITGLQTSLAKLGFTSEEIIKSTQGIANAAQALGSPLNATAEQIGKVINQFDLLIEQSDFIGDVLVTTINKSALSFEGFGTAIQYVGPIARNLGLDIQQTAGAMAVLADNGFTASRIGTGLRGIFTELGHTSADVESSLKDLATQNISLSEAVDLVGKRNASQLITLLDNIDAIEEGNKKYYEQGRAIAASAQQIDTFSGQMALLNSAFRETQIRFGDFILESDLVLEVLGFLSIEAEALGRAMKNINEIGFKKFNEGVESVLSGDITDKELAIELVAERTGKSIEEITKKYEEYSIGVYKNVYDPQLQTRREAFVKITSDEAIEVAGLVEEVDKLVEERKEQFNIEKGVNEVTKAYSQTVQDLIDKSLKGNNVNKESNSLYKDLEYAIGNYKKALKSSNGVTEEERIQYEAAIKQLKRYQEQVKNTTTSQEELANQKVKDIKEEAENIKKRIKAKNEETAEIIRNINEEAKQRTAVAEGAEEKAAIEAERQARVSEAYNETAKAIAGMKPVYEENNYLVEEAVKKNKKLAEVLGSEVISDLNNAFKDYSTQVKDLQKALEDGTIDQENYDAAIFALRQSLIKTIESFKALTETTPELEKFFDNLLQNFDALVIGTGKVEESFEEAFRTELIDSLDDALARAADAIAEFNEVSLENTKNRLDSEKSEIKNRYDIEEEILKSKLNNQLITESQYRKKQSELRKAQVAEENSIDKKIFDAEKKQDKQDATTDYLKAIAAIIPTLIAYDNTADPVSVLAKAAVTGALATASYGAELSAISQRKFYPKKFAKGGMVFGPSHSQGGVPFSVQGRSGFEMEGGEFIVNKEATARNINLLKVINESPRLNPTVGKVNFASGGIVPTPMDKSVDYLKAIAEATASTAIVASRPSRAYISDKDLVKNSTERRIRDRNDRI